MKLQAVRFDPQMKLFLYYLDYVLKSKTNKFVKNMFYVFLFLFNVLYTLGNLG